MIYRNLLGGCALLLAGLLLSVQAAQADQYENIIKAGKLRVATDLAIPPYGMMDSKLQPMGIDVDVSKLLAADWGLKLEWVETTSATRIPNLLTNKADVTISSLSITPQRAEIVDFSTPYTAIKSVIGGKASDPVKSYEDLRGRTVAVARGTTNDTDLTPLAAKYGFNLARYEDNPTLVTAIISGQNDLIGHTEQILQHINERSPELKYETKILARVHGIGVGVRKGEPKLVEKLNAWVDANMQNGKLRDIFKKYTGSELPEQIPGLQH